MSQIRFPILMRLAYEEAAQEYLRNLPPEHFMEATTQATQREITVESLALVKVWRPEVQVFSELLVLYPRPRKKKPVGVVPDNMIVVHPEPIRAETSFHIPLEPAGPFVVLEYVSKGTKRKDYDDNMHKYERELKVPYYLLFYPDIQDLTLYRHNKRKYVTVRPNEAGRVAIPELELEAALLDGWVRYWFRGELLPLPPDLLHERDQARTERDQARTERDQAKRALAAAQVQLEQQQQAQQAMNEELARLRAQLAQAERPPGTAS